MPNSPRVFIIFEEHSKEQLFYICQTLGTFPRHFLDILPTRPENCPKTFYERFWPDLYILTTWRDCPLQPKTSQLPHYVWVVFSALFWTLGHSTIRTIKSLRIDRPGGQSLNLVSGSILPHSMHQNNASGVKIEILTEITDLL